MHYDKISFVIRCSSQTVVANMCIENNIRIFMVDSLQELLFSEAMTYSINISFEPRSVYYRIEVSLLDVEVFSRGTSDSGCIMYFRAMKSKSTPKINNTTARPSAPPSGTASK